VAFPEMTSQPPSCKYDVISEIRLRQSSHSLRESDRVPEASLTVSCEWCLSVLVGDSFVSDSHNFKTISLVLR